MIKGVWSILKIMYPDTDEPLVILKEVTSGREYQKPFDEADIKDLKIEKGRFLLWAERGTLRLLGTYETKEEALKEYVKFNFN